MPEGGVETVADVLARDLYVISQLRERNIPVVMVPSGGYSRVSYELVADSVAALLRRLLNSGDSDGGPG